MGLFQSRRNTRTQEIETANTNAYRYPPKSGDYFGSHFIMGGERFETMKPDAYLFGENEDLNFLGNKPTPFPYPAPQPHEPTKTLKSLVNIRKDSLRFVKDSDESSHNNNTNPTQSNTCYNIEFTFDTDVKCAITIYYFAVEEIINKAVIYHPRDPNMNSETFHYKRGANQIFSQPTHFVDPSKFPEEDWQYSVDREIIPVVIHCVVEEEDNVGHSHMTLAVVDKLPDGSYALKPLKQKQMVDGLCYLLQEIYGIENKNTEQAKDDDFDDNGSECVICMCEVRDTIILPCRHLCLCNGCADNLRYQANNCPICRAKFRALLQIRAMHKKSPGLLNATIQQQGDSPDDTLISQEGVPPGYVAVSLIEALNGPTMPHCARNVATLTSDGTLQSLYNAAQGEIAAPPQLDQLSDINVRNGDNLVGSDFHCNICRDNMTNEENCRGRNLADGTAERCAAADYVLLNKLPLCAMNCRLGNHCSDGRSLANQPTPARLQELDEEDGKENESIPTSSHSSLEVVSEVINISLESIQNANDNTTVDQLDSSPTDLDSTPLHITRIQKRSDNDSVDLETGVLMNGNHETSARSSSSGDSRSSRSSSTKELLALGISDDHIATDV